jgi:hypothetical protein
VVVEKVIRFVENEKTLQLLTFKFKNEGGSPIFAMQLCKNARRSLVSVTSTEPSLLTDATVRPNVVFRRFSRRSSDHRQAGDLQGGELLRRLTQTIGYMELVLSSTCTMLTRTTSSFGAQPAFAGRTPVTEGVTGVNCLPHSSKLPWVFRSTAFRKFAVSTEDRICGNDKIDFMEEDYMPIEGVLAFVSRPRTPTKDSSLKWVR